MLTHRRCSLPIPRRGTFQHYDVFAEVLHERHLLGSCPGMWPSVLYDGFRWAHQADPDAGGGGWGPRDRGGGGPPLGDCRGQRYSDYSNRRTKGGSIGGQRLKDKKCYK